jgi:hypothetical protein
MWKTEVPGTGRTDARGGELRLGTRHVRPVRSMKQRQAEDLTYTFMLCRGGS